MKTEVINFVKKNIIFRCVYRLLKSPVDFYVFVPPVLKDNDVLSQAVIIHQFVHKVNSLFFKFCL